MLRFWAGSVCKNNGWTALHSAAFNGRLEVAQLLHEFGADWTATNNKGYTAQDLAQQVGAPPPQPQQGHQPFSAPPLRPGAGVLAADRSGNLLRVVAAAAAGRYGVDGGGAGRDQRGRGTQGHLGQRAV